MKHLDRAIGTGFVWASLAYMKSINNDFFGWLLASAVLITIFIWLGSIEQPIRKG